MGKQTEKSLRKGLIISLPSLKLFRRLLISFRLKSNFLNRTYRASATSSAFFHSPTPTHPVSVMLFEGLEGAMTFCTSKLHNTVPVPAPGSFLDVLLVILQVLVKCHF